MNSRFRMKKFQFSIKRYGFFGIRQLNFKMMKFAHDVYHHVNVISNLCDLDSALNLHPSALFQAMSAAACFMISGKCAPSHPSAH